MTDKIARIEITVGRLMCRHIRDFVNKMRFEGRSVRMWEGSGFLVRDFIIEGDPSVIHSIECWADECRRLKQDQ